MRLPIANEIRNEIVREWLAGIQRDKIAENVKVSGGTVSNVISNWREQLGHPTADSLRVLSSDLKTLGITPCSALKHAHF